VQLLDVREGWEYTLARLGWSAVDPLAELERRIGELDRDRALVVYCHHGIRSLHAAVALRSRGFETARSLRGGIDRWSQEIDSNTPRY
jgi:rhodanese-related sulfurtransferase